jgi:chemotaxis protein CheY-P-specific phosphatase CheC
MAPVTATELTQPLLLELLRRGMAEAAQALTEMSGRLIRVETSAVYLCSPVEAGDFVGGSERRVVVDMGVTGSLSGHTALVVSLPDARRLGAILLAGLSDEASDDPDGLGPLQASVLGEVTNVTVGTLVRELERTTGAPLRVSVPRLNIGPATELVRGLVPAGAGESGQAVIAITSFADATRELRGTLLVIPDPASFVTLQAALELS